MGGCGEPQHKSPGKVRKTGCAEADGGSGGGSLCARVPACECIAFVCFINFDLRESMITFIAAWRGAELETDEVLRECLKHGHAHIPDVVGKRFQQNLVVPLRILGCKREKCKQAILRYAVGKRSLVSRKHKKPGGSWMVAPRQIPAQAHIAANERYERHAQAQTINPERNHRGEVMRNEAHFV